MSAPARHTRTWRLVVAYHGAAFSGFQCQEDTRTVQGELQKALSTLAGEAVTVRGAGRTDAGVHARGQVVSTTFTSRVEPGRMLHACRGVLPADISVVRADVMHSSFDAKRDSIGKRYLYRFHNAVFRDPFEEGRAWHILGAVDFARMEQAAALFVGEHDFESFRSTHCDALHARRYLWRSHLVRTGATTFAYEVRGNAFCRHMVRTLAGTLCDVGRGRFTVDDVATMLVSRDRNAAGVTAPSHGLLLDEVYYPDTLAGAELPADARFPGYPVEPGQWPRVDVVRQVPAP